MQMTWIAPKTLSSTLWNPKQKYIDPEMFLFWKNIDYVGTKGGTRIRTFAEGKMFSLSFIFWITSSITKTDLKTWNTFTYPSMNISSIL